MEEKKKYTYLTHTITCPNGKRKYIRAKTQKELDEKVRAAKRDLAMGIDITSNLTVSELIQMWIDVYKRPRLRPQSLIHKLSEMNVHVVPYIGRMKVRDVKAAHILDVMNNHGYTAKQANAALLSDLRSIFKLAVDSDIITKSPVPLMLRPSGEDKDEVTPLSREQATELLRRLHGTSAYLFTLIALSTGMRKGEVLGLTWDNVDFANNQIRVRQQLIHYPGHDDGLLTDKLKTKSARRDVPMTHDLRVVLAEEKLKNKSPFVICGKDGAPITESGFSSFAREWHRVYPELDQNLHAHLFRHSYDTWLIGSGMDPKQVQYLMGHSNLDMTMSTYAHYERESRREETLTKVSAALEGVHRVS